MSRCLLETYTRVGWKREGIDRGKREASSGHHKLSENGGGVSFKTKARGELNEIIHTHTSGVGGGHSRGGS